MARLLLVEDDAAIAVPLERALARDGHEVAVATTGAGALEVLDTDIDAVVLDLGLPDVDGLDLCRRIRIRHLRLPVLVLTARADEIDVVVGLDAGADDYVTKPFRLAELLARIRVMLRRGAPDVVEANGIRIDRTGRRAWQGEREIPLSAKEFDLLALLVAEAGTVVPRDRIMDEVWHGPWYGSTRTLDMHVSWLRRKLGDDPASPRYLTTVRGVGLRFEKA